MPFLIERKFWPPLAVAAHRRPDPPALVTRVVLRALSDAIAVSFLSRADVPPPDLVCVPERVMSRVTALGCRAKTNPVTGRIKFDPDVQHKATV